jgi:hypothetical protein
MNREFQIEALKTYATIKNARKAVAKAGDEGHRHFYMRTEEGRWFPVFVWSDEVSRHGVYFRWNVVG